MDAPFDEGIKKQNDLPLSVQCLIMPLTTMLPKWGRLHYHDYIELLYTVKGNVSVNVCGKEYLMTENTAVIINSGEPHCTAGDGDRTLLCIKFLPQVLFSSEQTVTGLEYLIPYIFENFGHKRFFEKELLECAGLHKAFLEIYDEHSEKRFGYELAIRAYVMHIFSWIIRYWHDIAGEISVPSSGSPAAAIIRKAREYTDSFYGEATLESAAEWCGLSYSYFSRLFSSYMHMGYSDYLNRVRVNESVRLLATTDLTVTEIAMAVGFSSASYYISVFKSLKGISPGSFRKKIRYT